MVTVKTAGNIKINQSAMLQLAESIAYGLHRYTCAAGTAGAVKACAYQTTLAKGSQTDNLLAQGLVKARCSVRAALHHLAVKLNGQLSLADTCMNQLRCNNIQHFFVNSAGVFHLLQLISTLAQTQLLQHSIKGANLFKSKILMQHTLPVQGSLLCFYIHNARRTSIIGSSFTKAVHRTNIAEMRFIYCTLIIAAHPENCILRTNQQHTLLHCTCKIIHCNLMINCSHLPTGMHFIHQSAKFLQTRLKLTCGHGANSISQYSSLLQNSHSNTPFVIKAKYLYVINQDIAKFP